MLLQTAPGVACKPTVAPFSSCKCDTKLHTAAAAVLRHASLKGAAAPQVALEQRNAQLEALVAEQQQLQQEGSTVGPRASADAAEEPCSNGCADASWQDATLQVAIVPCCQLVTKPSRCG